MASIDQITRESRCRARPWIIGDEPPTHMSVWQAGRRQPVRRASLIGLIRLIRLDTVRSIVGSAKGCRTPALELVRIDACRAHGRMCDHP